MQTALMALEVVARINRINIDLRMAQREYGLTDRELTKEELLLVAKGAGFKARIKKMLPDELFARYPLPAIVLFRDKGFGVILKANGEEKSVLLFFPAEKQARSVSFDEFTTLSDGECIVLKHKMISSQVAFGFQWFYNEILHYKNVMAEVLTGSFVVQLFGLVTPLFTQVILDKVIVHRSMTTLDVLAVAFIAVALFEFLLNTTRNYIFIHTTNKIDAKLGSKLFRHLFSLPFVYFESRKVGNIVARVRELDNIRDFITNKSVSVIIDLCFSLVFVAVMFLYSVKLTLVFIAFVCIVGTLYVTVTPELRRRLEYKFQMAAQSNSYLVESVTGIQTVKSLALEGSMQKRWEENLEKYVHSSFKLSNMSNIAGAVSGTFQRMMTITVLYLGVKLVIDNQLTIGQLIAFQMFAGQFTGPFLRLVNLWNEFQQALLSVDRIGDILNNPVEIRSGRDITLPKLDGAVRFENVSFRYSPDSPDALQQVSFAVRPGMSVGLVGRSGSGKSTITKLIERLYILSEGAIYIDDIDVRHMNPVWLRYNIGVVLQDDYLFSGTIGENIMLPRPDAPMEAVIGASKIAGAHEFISQLPEGYDTQVGERGSTLSGGQKQRIAIARALITNPRILIFDEATSSLDYESERIIQKNINRIKAGRTMFIVAHRLSMVKDCDLIIALDKGKVMETGTHEMLMAKKGYYHHLYTQQEAA
ncbi:MAG TPA: type I secretion system permease/ATPase [Syntrophorhabdaceae bacterium]|nr:type I secretion system permease/ATPase [Syntrophorhabdaceae bacterium]HQM80646.1 type I secretion system permease/ATPase [Syntrophorhabdaceae bacterium]